MPRDLVGGLFWLAVAIFAASQGVTLKLGSLSRPGPGFFPFWGGVILGLFSLALLARSLGQAERLSLAGIRWPMFLLVVGALLGYLLALESLGFVIVTVLFLLILFRAAGRSWLFSAALSLVAAGLAHVIFRVWLKTQLPVGPLGF